MLETKQYLNDYCLLKSSSKRSYIDLCNVASVFINSLIYLLKVLGSWNNFVHLWKGSWANTAQRLHVQFPKCLSKKLIQYCVYATLQRSSQKTWKAKIPCKFFLHYLSYGNNAVSVLRGRLIKQKVDVIRVGVEDLKVIWRYTIQQYL